MSNKFFWLKLKRDFFKRHDIRIIEEMPNGKEYILFYLKLLVESIDHEGELRFSDTVPYNEQMLSVITNTNIDIVRSAMKVFIQLKMIEVLDDETIYMTEVQNMIGGETKWAEKKRIQRKKDNVRLLSQICPTEIEKEKEIDKDTDIEKDISISTAKKPVKHKHGEYNNVLLTDEELEKLQAEYPDCQERIERLSSYMASTGKAYKSHYATIRNWARKDQKPAQIQQPRRNGNVFLDMLGDEF